MRARMFGSMAAIACVLAAAPAAPAQGFQFADIGWGASIDSTSRVLTSRGYRIVERRSLALGATGTVAGHRSKILALFGRRGLARVFVEVVKVDSALFEGMAQSLAEKYGQFDLHADGSYFWRITVPIGSYSMVASRANGGMYVLYDSPLSATLEERSESAVEKRLRKALTRDF